MAEKLKREFIELLERDAEFRYTVAGYLGLSEILKRLDRLEEGQNKLWEEVRSLREGQNKLWEEVKALRLEQDRMRRYMVAGFRDLRRALGVTFEEHAASFLEVLLDGMGYPGAVVEKKYLVDNGGLVEVNLFCERPLVVGEVTISVQTAAEAAREVEKLLRRVELVERKRREKPFMTVLSVARANPESSEALRNLAQKHGIKLILGREIEEELPV